MATAPSPLDDDNPPVGLLWTNEAFHSPVATSTLTSAVVAPSANFHATRSILGSYWPLRLGLVVITDRWLVTVMRCATSVSAGGVTRITARCVQGIPSC